MTRSAILSVPLRRMRAVEESIPSNNLASLEDVCETTGFEYSIEVVDQMLAGALKRVPPEGANWKSELDAYLAPRLHLAFRLPRAFAARPGVWVWCALRPMRPYMERRWPLNEDSTLWRFTSRDVLRNGVARLWWAAELLRDGPDYSLVPRAMESVRWFQFVSELRYSMHRECARAFARTLVECEATDALAQELSKRFNVYLRASALETHDYADEDSVASGDQAWLTGESSLGDLALPVAELVGPRDGRSRNDIEDVLFQWLRDVAHEIA